MVARAVHTILVVMILKFKGLKFHVVVTALLIIFKDYNFIHSCTCLFTFGTVLLGTEENFGQIYKGS